MASQPLIFIFISSSSSPPSETPPILLDFTPTPPPTNSGLGPPDPTRPNHHATSPTEPGSTISASTPRYDHTCKEIFKGWNCISGNKSNGRDLTKWQWRISASPLPCSGRRVVASKKRAAGDGFVNNIKKLQRREIFEQCTSW